MVTHASIAAMSDLENEKQGCAMVGIAAVIFVVCAFWSWRELRYVISGRTVEATVTSAQVETVRSGRRSVPRERLVVRYSFPAADGQTYPGEQTFDPDHPPPVGTVRVQYLPDDPPPPNRIKGTGSMLPVLVFLAAIAALAFFAWRAWKQAGEDVARSRR